MATKNLNLKPQRRFFQLQREAVINEEARTVRLSFCTEDPVERWWGIEILDCAPGSVRLDRLKATGPLLFNHDPDNLIGKVENVWMDADRKGYADVRVSSAADCESIWQKVMDGTLDNVSVGYMIDDLRLEKKEGDVETYRAMAWTPYEISLVSIPADINCGVGRDAEFGEAREVCVTVTVEIEQEEAPAADPAEEIEKPARTLPEKGDRTMERTPEQIAKETRDAEILRINTLRTLGDKHQAAPEAERFMTEGRSIDEFRTFLLDRPAAPVVAEETRQPAQPVVTVSSRFDSRSLKPFMRGASGDVRKAESDAYRSGMWARAVIFGDASAQRWCKDNGLDVRVMTTLSGSAGGYTVPDAVENAIIDLRAQYGIARKIAQVYPMSTGTLSIPKWNSGTTAYFAGENTATTESDASFAQVQLVAKELSALTRISSSLAEDAIIDLAAFVAEQQAYAFAIKEDSCLIDGDGGATYGGITGLKTLLETAGMAGIYTTATNSDMPSEIIMSELNGLMAKLPSYALNGASFLCSPAYKQMILTRLQAAGGGNTMMTLADGSIGQGFLGYPVNVGEQCYSALATDYTGKAMLFFGNFRQGIAFGERRGITIQVLTERYAEYRQVGIIGSERIDISCHGCGDASNAGPIVALIGG